MDMNKPIQEDIYAHVTELIVAFVHGSCSGREGNEYRGQFLSAIKDALQEATTEDQVHLTVNALIDISGTLQAMHMMHLEISA